MEYKSPEELSDEERKAYEEAAKKDAELAGLFIEHQKIYNILRRVTESSEENVSYKNAFAYLLEFYNRSEVTSFLLFIKSRLKLDDVDILYELMSYMDEHIEGCGIHPSFMTIAQRFAYQRDLVYKP